MIAESVASPYIIDNLESNTEYTVKVVNRGGESGAVTFTTKEITYKEVTITLDMKDKVAGSVVENPHGAYAPSLTSLMYPGDATSAIEFSNQLYTQLSELDSSLATIERSNGKQIAQVLFSFNVIEAIEREYQNFFDELENIDEKTNLILERQKSMTFNVRGSGSGASGNKITVNRRIGESWTAATTSENNSLQNLKATYTDGRLLSMSGYIYILTNAPASDGTTASSVSIDYASLELTFLVEED